MYVQGSAFEWDPGKAAANLRKHGVRFATEAVSAFDDNDAITVRDEVPDEQRFILLGMSMKARLIVLVYTYRGESIRIISARPATPRERKQYEAQT